MFLMCASELIHRVCWLYGKLRKEEFLWSLSEATFVESGFATRKMQTGRKYGPSNDARYAENQKVETYIGIATEILP